MGGGGEPKQICKYTKQNLHIPSCKEPSKTRSGGSPPPPPWLICKLYYLYGSVPRVTPSDCPRRRNPVTAYFDSAYIAYTPGCQSEVKSGSNRTSWDFLLIKPDTGCWSFCVNSPLPALSINPDKVIIRWVCSDRFRELSVLYKIRINRIYINNKTEIISFGKHIYV